MDFSGLKDTKTTIAGLIVIGIAALAMFKGLCTWDQWWTVVLAVLAAAGGGSLLLTGGKKPSDPTIGPGEGPQ